MSRRSSQVEPEFGSDSFLDIIANIVGILIILIVVAGVRVTNARAVSNRSDSESIQPAAGIVDERLPISEPALPVLERQRFLTAEQIAIQAEINRPSAPIKPALPPIIEPSRELLARIADIQSALESMKGEQTSLASQLRNIETRRQNVIREIENLSQILEQKNAERGDRNLNLVKLEKLLKRAKADLAELNRKTEDAQRHKAPVKKFEHRLTPVSRVVEGKEIHFRLYRNRVAYVPIDELGERLRPQITRHKDWIIKYKKHRGQVGPVNGFTMKYVVQRQPISALDELSGGVQFVRIGVSRWQIEPEDDLQTESTKEALKPVSLFRRRLDMSDPEVTVTFWVYPGSFEMHRALKQFAHQQGFNVAARPLPFGIPIAGSPQGTRSSSQ